jgi:hypothetical protein
MDNTGYAEYVTDHFLESFGIKAIPEVDAMDVSIREKFTLPHTNPHKKKSHLSHQVTFQSLAAARRRGSCQPVNALKSRG